MTILFQNVRYHSVSLNHPLSIHSVITLFKRAIFKANGKHPIYVVNIIVNWCGLPQVMNWLIMLYRLSLIRVLLMVSSVEKKSSFYFKNIIHRYCLDFWTSGMYQTNTKQWQWGSIGNRTDINIDKSITNRLENVNQAQSLLVTFNPTIRQHLTNSLPSSKYATICKRHATPLTLNDETRSLHFISQSIALHNQ